VILVTVGSQLGFDRLIGTVATWAREKGVRDVLLQTGPCGLDLTGLDHVEKLPPDETRRIFERARVVIGHAGMGTIIDCLLMEKPLVILPRKASLGEHRNDHQMATARRFANRPGVTVAWDEHELRRRLDDLDALLAPQKIDPHASPELLAAIRAFIHGS
jgi:UDP-N-acetylglucosamine transferase subunit ALG13